MGQGPQNSWSLGKLGGGGVQGRASSGEVDGLSREGGQEASRAGLSLQAVELEGKQ